MSKADTGALADMLMWRRPHGSKSELKFIEKFIFPLGVKRDKFGNIWKRIGDAPLMWSCHTDSVHSKGGKQRLRLLEGRTLALPLDSDSNCLGADNAAGIWLMSELIKAGRPGLYIFHRGEERGGLGSTWLAANRPGFVKDIKWAIALDRRGTTSVITYQSTGRCCSDTFAKELATRIGGKYAPDETGVYTDTANYVRLIPECTNLSVGYDHEHTRREELDCEHIIWLRKRLIALDVVRLPLPVERDPSVKEYRKYSSWSGYYGDDDYSYSGNYGRVAKGHKWVFNKKKGRYTVVPIPDDSKKYHEWLEKRAKNPHLGPQTYAYCPTCYRSEKYCTCDAPKLICEVPAIADDGGSGAIEHGYTPANYGREVEADDDSHSALYSPNVKETIKRNPEIVLKIMEAYGLSESEILDEIYQHGGAVHY